MQTSDEVCWFLLKKRPIWKVGMVGSRIRCDVPDLLHMEALTYEPFIERVAPRSKPKHKATVDLPRELDVDDPFATGAAGARVGRASRFDKVDDCGGVVEHDTLEEDEDLNPDDAEGNMREVHGADDALDLVPESEGEQVELAEDDFRAAPVGLDDAGGEAGNSALDPDGDLLDLLAELEDGVQPAAPPTVEEVIRAANMDHSGYVRAQHEPWNKLNPAGRLTSWPRQEQNLARRSFSMKCYFHPGCSFAKKGSAVSSENFMRWLFAAEVCEGDQDARRAAAAMHMALGRSGNFLPGGWASGVGPTSPILGTNSNSSSTSGVATAPRS